MDQRNDHHVHEGRQTSRWRLTSALRAASSAGLAPRCSCGARPRTFPSRDWLAANPRVQVHFTPTSGSWLNLVEVWFGIIERQAIHRGTFRSVAELNQAIRAFIDGWNGRAHPFVWTKTADQILCKANRQKTSTTAH